MMIFLVLLLSIACIVLFLSCIGLRNKIFACRINLLVLAGNILDKTAELHRAGKDEEIFLTPTEIDMLMHYIAGRYIDKYSDDETICKVITKFYLLHVSNY